MENRTSSRKTRVGLVVSDKMDKTVVVAIADRVAHPLYKKIVKSTYKLRRTTRERVWHRRPRAGHGDPAPVQGQALARRRDHREGEVRRCRNDSAGKLSEGCRQHRRQRD